MTAKCFFISLLFLSSVMNAQFSIKGTIDHYANKSLYIKVGAGSGDRLLNKVMTNEKGYFEYNVGISYTGMLILEFENGVKQNMFSDNKNIVFKTDFNNSNKNMNYLVSDINKYYEKRLKQERLKLIKGLILDSLINVYDPTDKFYKDIKVESTRINHFQKILGEDKSIVDYYINRKKMIDDAFVKSDSVSIKARAVEVKKNLINDDEFLESSGIIKDLTVNYLSLISNGAETKYIAGQKINVGVDDLLADLHIETPRGQDVLNIVINTLKPSGLESLADKYLMQAKALTCHINDDLGYTLAVNESIQVGKTAPDFKFESQLVNTTKYKSFHEIKSKYKLLIFWASWCSHCREKIPFVQEFYKNNKDKGLEIVAISLDTNEKKYLGAIKEYSWINYSDLLKWSSPIVKLYGIQTTPTMFLLDKDNKIIQVVDDISSITIEP